MQTRDVVICEPVRTAIGGYGEVLKSLTAAELGVSALTGLLCRTGVDPSVIDGVILVHCYPTPDAPAIGRVVALDSGLPVSVGGQQVDRRLRLRPAGGHQRGHAGRAPATSSRPTAPSR